MTNLFLVLSSNAITNADGSVSVYTAYSIGPATWILTGLVLFLVLWSILRARSKRQISTS